MAFRFIETAPEGGVFVIRLARPPANVLHAPMMEEIGAALDAADATPEVHAVLVTGATAGMFSGGVEVADHAPERVGELMAGFARLLRKLRDFPLPTVAGLNGSTLGGALELALACDMMVATPQAKIGHPEIKLASIAFPGILMLQDRLPANHIAELLALGEPMDGTTAHRLGLVNRLVDAQDFHAGALAFMAPLARLSRPALRLLMRTLHEARGRSLENGFDAAARLFMEELMVLEDAAEGPRAFAERRRPLWKHR